ncbi:MAG: c-type cytochrome [Bdellovibrionia bacterium]
MSENRDEYNRGGMFAFTFSMAFVLAFFVYLVAVNKGVDLGENIVDPNAPASTEAAAPAFDITTVAEPWVENPEVIAYGKKLYATNCAMCHGAEGKGDGAAGAGLNPKPRNLVEGGWKLGPGIIAKYKVLSEGLTGTSMASYAHLKSADRWAMAQFIQSITNDKGSDDPAAVAAFAKTAK